MTFVSVAFGEEYVKQLHRLKESILDIYPDAIIYAWEDELPPGSKPFLESLYGFKVHAVKKALEDGHEKIIFMDPACILRRSVDYWFGMIGSYGVIAARDEQKLENCISDKAVRYFGNPDMKGWHLCGGSVYVFDFSIPLCRKIFNDWERAERDGIFGSQEEAASGKIEKHRNDESCMSVSLYSNGSEPVRYDLCRYDKTVDPIVIKRHFK